MRWRRVTAPGLDVCYLLPEPGETDRLLVAAVAAASFNSAWPEGSGWERWWLQRDSNPCLSRDGVFAQFYATFRLV